MTVQVELGEDRINGTLRIFERVVGFEQFLMRLHVAGLQLEGQSELRDGFLMFALLDINGADRLSE